jgi:hypothetical protein
MLPRCVDALDCSGIEMQVKVTGASHGTGFGGVERYRDAHYWQRYTDATRATSKTSAASLPGNHNGNLGDAENVRPRAIAAEAHRFIARSSWFNIRREMLDAGGLESSSRSRMISGCRQPSDAAVVPIPGGRLRRPAGALEPP